MSEQLIFVSCGQSTPEEKTLGVLLKTAIEGIPGFCAYFAETVQDLQGLSDNVFDALRRCAGAVIILHERGIVNAPDGEPLCHRSSVWVNQEIAILAYRRFLEASGIPILAFADPKVKLEGAMTKIIVNPRPLADPQTVVDHVKTWLSTEEFASVSDDAFREKWDQLPETARIAAAILIDQGGVGVKEHLVRSAITKTFGYDSMQVYQAFEDAKQCFINTDLVKLIPNNHSGHELSVHPTWKFQLQRQVAQWRRDREKDHYDSHGGSHD